MAMAKEEELEAVKGGESEIEENLYGSVRELLLTAHRETLQGPSTARW
jgi:hypothetical protein